MNYIHLINQFWRTRRRLHLTSVTADLYYFLIHECNEQEWSNPFECPNGLILSSIGISESALSDARNRLKQLGLIDFQAGKRNERSPVYRLFYPARNGKTEGKTEGKEQGKTEGKNPNLLKETKPKLNDSEPNGSGAESKKSKKIANDPEHWHCIVDIWFKFYNSKKGEDPTFDKASAGALKSILQNFKKRAMQRGQIWDEAYATDIFTRFLNYAYNLTWIKDNFLLTNLNRQFDKIITSNGKQESTNKQQRGSGVANFANSIVAAMGSDQGDSQHQPGGGSEVANANTW